MSPESDSSFVEDYIVRLQNEVEGDVEYHLFDHTGYLRRSLGKEAISTMLEGRQPWADFALLHALNRPPYKPEDVVMPVILNAAGLALESKDLSLKLYPYPEETIDAFTQAHPDVRFSQRDVAFQGELVIDDAGTPNLLSTRIHEQIGTFHDSTFTPFVTLLS